VWSTCQRQPTRRAQLAAQAINFLVIPFAALLIGRWFFPTESLLMLGLLLAALLPLLLVRMLIPLLLLYGFNFLLSMLVARRFFSRSEGIALVIALAYIVQVQTAAWYVKFSDRLFGPVSIEAPVL